MGSLAFLLFLNYFKMLDYLLIWHIAEISQNCSNVTRMYQVFEYLFLGPKVKRRNKRSEKKKETQNLYEKLTWEIFRF